MFIYKIFDEDPFKTIFFKELCGLLNLSFELL